MDGGHGEKITNVIHDHPQGGYGAGGAGAGALGGLATGLFGGVLGGLIFDRIGERGRGRDGGCGDGGGRGEVSVEAIANKTVVLAGINNALGDINAEVRQGNTSINANIQGAKDQQTNFAFGLERSLCGLGSRVDQSAFALATQSAQGFCAVERLVQTTACQTEKMVLAAEGRILGALQQSKR